MFSIQAIALSLSVLEVVKGTPIPNLKILVARDFNMYANWPSYDQLPLHPSFPMKAAWGVWVSLSLVSAIELVHTNFDSGRRRRTRCFESHHT